MITEKIEKCFEELSEVQLEILDMQDIELETRFKIVNRIQDKKAKIMNIFLDTEKADSEPAKIVLDTEDNDNGK